jgi:phage shock protein A
MTNQHLFDTARTTASRDAAQIATLLAKLNRTIARLSLDIEQEEERAQVRDLLDPAYPMLARTLAARRNNLRATVAALEALVDTGDHENLGSDFPTIVPVA